MSDNLAKAQDVFLDKINQICGKFGLNNIMAQLYAILYLSDNPMSLNDMVDRLKISKASASINIRALERYGMVRRAWVKGSRKDYYEAESDIAKVVIDRVRSMIKSRLSEVDDMLVSSYRALKQAIPGDGGHESDDMIAFRSKIDRLKNLYDTANSLFEVINSSQLFSDRTQDGEDSKDGSVVTAERHS